MIDKVITMRSSLLNKRYRSERRFKLFGLLSLTIPAFFLIFLVCDVVKKGLPAFFEHSVTLSITIPFEERNASAIDYNMLTKETLKAVFPTMTSRQDKKSLLGILSNGAFYNIRQRVTDNPSLTGKTINAELLLSSDADLYFKNDQNSLLNVSNVSGAGDLHVERDGEKYNISGSIATIATGNILAFNKGALRVKTVEKDQLSAEKIITPTRVGAVASGQWRHMILKTVQEDRRINDQQIIILESLKASGAVSKNIAWRLFFASDSREPELAGIYGALIGSLLTIFVTLLISLPIGIAAALYLEEFAKKGALTNFVEVNINNLAAVPSIIFGLLGLAVFLNFFGMPRSAPLVGGFVLALLVMPTIIITSRAAIRSVPPSIKEAALGVGASHQQAVFHHIFPLAIPGILTGIILSIARALGETAPLLMIGMVAFIVDVPNSFTDAATLLPVQIYLWSDLPELGFQARTAAAIMILMLVLFVLNGCAIYLRKRFERRW
jgi:phosphate transport system permease protein